MRVRWRVTRTLAAGLWIAACTTPGAPESLAGTERGSEVGPLTAVGSTSAAPDEPSASAGIADTTTSGSESSSSGGIDPTAFLLNPDGYVSQECSVWSQNCPPGEKCMPWANNGEPSWNATRCSPIAPDPGQADDPCTVEGSGVSGIDDCDVGLMCWGVDPALNTGTCIPMCLGSENDPHCADPHRMCSINCEGVLALCLDTCHPLAQDCRSGQACYPLSWYFVCAPNAGGDTGAYGDACEYLNVCDPGLACLSAELVADCNPAFAGCCAAFCSLGGRSSCPGDGEACLPWFDAADTFPGYEDVGICILPR